MAPGSQPVSLGIFLRPHYNYRMHMHNTKIFLKSPPPESRENDDPMAEDYSNRVLAKRRENTNLQFPTLYASLTTDGKKKKSLLKSMNVRRLLNNVVTKEVRSK